MCRSTPAICRYVGRIARRLCPATARPKPGVTILTPPSVVRRSQKLASDLPAIPHVQRVTASAPLPPQTRGSCGSSTIGGTSGLVRLNSASATDAEADFLRCCASRRWAGLMADHRPYPNLGALLAASDEAVYCLAPDDLVEALAGESATPLPPGGSLAAQTALSAANAEYERRFGRAFVICLAAVDPAEQTNHILAGIRTRLGNHEEEERVVAADELRALVRARLAQLIAGSAPTAGPAHTASATHIASAARTDLARHEPPRTAR
jgi:2-oxo-4-hydroxy-4-carboxy-5-ureidoimidazoline decarboxylase